MDNNILLVAPYDKLERLVRDIRDNINVPFSIIKGNFIGKKCEKIGDIYKSIAHGTKIIVTRGGTAAYLGTKINIPVIEIPVTSFDILRSISSVTNRGYKKIAVVTISNIIYKKNYFNNISDINVEFESCNNVEEIPEAVDKIIKNNKIDALIGDVIAVLEAKKHGIYSEILESGQEAVVQALNQAVRMIQYNIEEKARVKEIESILNVIDEGVLTADKDNRISVYNKSAQKILGYPQSEVIGNKMQNIFPVRCFEKINKGSPIELGKLIKLGDRRIVSNIIKILVDNKIQGTVAIFQQVDDIQKLELNIRKKLNEKGLVAKYNFDDIIGNSDSIMKTKSLAFKFAHSEGTILIVGESGTGKELFAHSIHNVSRRKNGPFVSINCASLNENLLESELFGYEEGAFTGASKGGKKGLFEIAHGGTLFLDEIGEISLNFQSRLLRVLQEREIRRVGAEKIIPVDVRIICATNKNLRDEVINKNFREDLYYRLSVLELRIDPLRNRKEDIIPMAISLMEKECANENRHLYWKNEDVFKCLLDYSWAGNVRELKNFIDKLVICNEGEEITEKSLMEILNYNFRDRDCNREMKIRVSDNLKEMESDIIYNLLKEYNGDKDRLCRKLNMSKTTLWRKLNFKNEK
ncbi:sigma 54-interacting transcriptional regulator [Clostridium sp. Mt-5]|uniref:Sigma 54-interacting transcriptional regulator n=1 Tax=Clostridium moutaii TaxID=3240932 RepID=A0ABV4BNX9_9CLOT